MRLEPVDERPAQSVILPPDVADAADQRRRVIEQPERWKRRSADALTDHLTGGVDDRDNQWHLPQSMCGTTQARIVGADTHFDGVHHAFGDLGLATEIVLCDAAYRSVEHLLFWVVATMRLANVTFPSRSAR